MKLTTEFREKSPGFFSATVKTVLVCTITFSQEERAIISERGLYQHYLEFPNDPKSLSAVGTGSIGCLSVLAKYVLIPFGAIGFLGNYFILNEGWKAFWCLVVLAVGVAIFALKFLRVHNYENKLDDPYKRYTVGDLMTNPTFIIETTESLQGKELEEEVRRQATVMAEVIRSSASVGENTTYELGQKSYDL